MHDSLMQAANDDDEKEKQRLQRLKVWEKEDYMKLGKAYRDQNEMMHKDYNLISQQVGTKTPE